MASLRPELQDVEAEHAEVLVDELERVHVQERQRRARAGQEVAAAPRRHLAHAVEHEPAGGAQEAQALVHGAPAARLEDDVRALGGPCANRRRHVFRAVVDGALGAAPPCRFHLGRTAAGAGHPRSRRQRDLERGQPDAAGDAVHEHAVAGLHAGHRAERRPRGDEHDREPRALFERPVVGERKGLGHRHHDLVGVAAEARPGHDPRAHGEVGSRLRGLGGDLRDRARHFIAGHEGLGGRFRVEAHAHEQIGEVDAGGGDANAHRARGERVGRALAHFEHVHIAVSGDHHAAHHAAITHHRAAIAQEPAEIPAVSDAKCVTWWSRRRRPRRFACARRPRRRGPRFAALRTAADGRHATRRGTVHATNAEPAVASSPTPRKELVPCVIASSSFGS